MMHIIHETVEIKLPHYLKQVTHRELSRLRSDHRDLTHVVCEIEEELDVFKCSFFNRTYLFWNSLPKDLRELQNYDEFQSRLKEHLLMWEFSEFNSELNTTLPHSQTNFQLNVRLKTDRHAVCPNFNLNKT